MLRGAQLKLAGLLLPTLPLLRLQRVETHQQGIHDALVGMEGEAERLYREERPLQDDDSK